MRAAIYARMSTDKQTEDSTADQVAACRKYAARAQGWEVVDVVEDAGISGASRHARTKFLELIARMGSWDVLLCWDFSRLARNEEDLGWVRNRVASARKNAIAVTTGRPISDLGSRVEGILAAEYLHKLKVDTHRGLASRFERELATGARPYGYRSESAVGGYHWIVDPGRPPSCGSSSSATSQARASEPLRPRSMLAESPRPAPGRIPRGPPIRSTIPAREPDLPRRGDVEPQRVREGPRDRQTPVATSGPRASGCAARLPSWRSSTPRPGRPARAELGRRGGNRASSPSRRNLLYGLLACSSCGGAFCGVNRRALRLRCSQVPGRHLLRDALARTEEGD